MNPMSNIESINRMNDRELESGIAGTKNSWHHQYRDSAWIYVGGLPYDLTEGDIISVFSQYGELVHINLVRDKGTGKSKGFCFICFEDQRSTVLTVDNLNGIKLLGRTIRVDHVAEYKVPKEHENDSEAVKKLRREGIAPKISEHPENPEEESNRKRKKEKKQKHSRQHSEDREDESFKKSKKKDNRDKRDRHDKRRM